MLKLPDGEGVLPGHLLEQSIDAGAISAGASDIPRSNVQPASLDLRLGGVAYRIRCSFLPDQQTVERKMENLIIDKLDSDHESTTANLFDQSRILFLQALEPDEQALAHDRRILDQSLVVKHVERLDRGDAALPHAAEGCRAVHLRFTSDHLAGHLASLRCEA